MHNNQIEAKMLKQIGISLQSLEWFILHGFIKSIVEDPEKVKLLFASVEDSVVVEGILFKIQKQFAPHLDDNTSDVDKLENLLKLPPKKVILPQGSDIIV